METVALEWISLLEVGPRDVVQFVQQLNNVPQDAVCEVGDIFSRKCHSVGLRSAKPDECRIRNEVHLSCEPRVAEFLCKKFCKQTQHVTGGEVIRVRCKRVYPGVKPLGKILPRKEDAKPQTEPNESTGQTDTNTSAAPVLSMEKVIALIDLLGDQVAEAQEAYQLFADSDAQGLQRMTMFGLSKALTKLCKSEWTAKSSKAKKANSSECGEAKLASGNAPAHHTPPTIQVAGIAMSLLPSAVKTPISSEVSSSGVKIKRKSRHHRTSPAEEPERQMEVEAPRERSHHSRGIEASKPNRNRRSSTLTSSGEGTSRRTPSYSSNRHSNGTPSLASKRRSEQPSVALHATISTRRTLTSSASSIRPSNRKRIEESPYRSGGHQRSSGNNNNSGLEEVNQHFYKQEDWLPSSNNQTSRVTLPSRASKYRNLSAGVVKKPRVRPTAAPASKELPDRPPSRQRHAFPTHLTDANAFDAPETTRKREGSFSSCSSTSSARSCERRASAVDSTSPEGVTDRPPSRYMVKAKRNSTQTLRQDPNALSRRGVVEKNMSFSCNQTHHDPKTDGFADVDESVPPPFRIKVTTDASETTPRLKTTRDPLSARHWPFSNQEQLLQMAVRGSDGSRSSDQAMTDLQSQLQWFGKDDQINNAHLFETIITLPSPRPTLEPEVVTIEDDPEDSFGPEFQSWKVVTKEPQNEPQHVENHFPSRRAAAASKTADALPVSDQPDQWIRSSTNPFFVEPSPTVDFDSMDPETAIEQTPLYSAEDLMTFTATEMTDLHLDDYTAASIPAPPPSSGGWSSRLLSASGSLPLRTSLGKDFLSLFAQH